MQKIIKKIKNRIDKINIPEKKIVTKCDITLSKFLTDFEEKIKKLQKSYINILTNKQKNNDKIIEFKNEIKKIYKDMIKIIKEKLEKPNQKYYYNIILKIIKKYEYINNEDIIPKKLNKTIQNKVKSDDNKEINKSWYNIFCKFLITFVMPFGFGVCFFVLNNK